jgi:hypothetical protein
MEQDMSLISQTSTSTAFSGKPQTYCGQSQMDRRDDDRDAHSGGSRVDGGEGTVGKGKLGIWA